MEQAKEKKKNKWEKKERKKNRKSEEQKAAEGKGEKGWLPIWWNKTQKEKKDDDSHKCMNMGRSGEKERKI